MSTCFVFTHKMTEDGYLSLRLDDANAVDSPLKIRSFDEIKILQASAKTVVVIPSNRCVFHRIELPWLGYQKARRALPYALEEDLAQPLSTLHLAFDQAHYRDKHYLVTVIDKTYFVELIQRLDTLLLDFDCITVDWFALKQGERCVGETNLLINEDSFQGALSTDLALKYSVGLDGHLKSYQFNDSTHVLKNSNFLEVNESFYEWTAKRLAQTSPMNLCQGEFQHDTRSNTCRRWYRLTAMLFGCSILVFFLTNGFMLYRLNHELFKTEQQISSIYHQYFPHAKSTVSPRFRVEQLLKSQGSSNRTLWTLLDALAVAFKQHPVTIDQIKYQTPVLVVTLKAKDFAQLELFQRQLQKYNIQVVQKQASLDGSDVASVLELHL